MDHRMKLAQCVLFPWSLRSSAAISDVWVIVHFWGIILWRARRHFPEKHVILQHALKHRGAQNSVQCSRWTACSVWSHRSRSASHRQIVDSLRKGSYLSDGSFRVLHLWKVTESTQIHLKTKQIYCVINKFNWESVYLFQVLKVILVDPGASLEAAVFWHFHIHGAHVLLTVVLTFLPQSAKTSKRQAPWLKEDKGHN